MVAAVAPAAASVLTGRTVIRALCVEVEAAQGHDLVAPPLDSGRARHPEAVHVDDPAAHAELRHVGHRRHALVAHHRQPFGGHAEAHPFRLCRPPSRFEHQSHRVEGGRHAGSFRAGARGRHQHPHRAMQQRLEALDPFARDLEVGLLGPQPLALRVQARHGTEERLDVGEPTLGVARRSGQDHEHSLRETA
ncbi:MAG: hypothetical protein DMD49_08770, partial [Gemmatimonadetes bacterium]